MLSLRAKFVFRLVALLIAVPALVEQLIHLEGGSLVSAAPLSSDSPSNLTVSDAGSHSFDTFLSPSTGLELPLVARGPDESIESGGNAFMHLQQHINKARRRLAHITGTEVPTDEELHSALQKRRLWIEDNWVPLQRRDAQFQEEAEHHEASLGAYLAAKSGKMINFVRRKGNQSSKLEARSSSGYSKAAFNAAKEHSVTDAPSVSADHSVGLSIEANDVGYFMNVNVGSNNKQFKMLIDSGSSDTWITGDDCSNCGGGNRNKLGKSTSSSLHTKSKQYKISYGTGTVTISEASDSMSIAGMKLSHFNFGVASKESGDFGGSNVPFDGLLGLGGKSLSTTGDDTPIQALYNQKQVDQPVVGYRLGRVADGDNKGQITFGAVDSSQVSGSLNEYSNQGNGYWKIELGGVKVGNKDIGASGSATLDTGTSLIVAPPDQADAIHNAIKGAKSDGQGGYTLPCTTNVKLSFTFGGNSYTMNSKDLLFSVNGNNMKGTCVSAVSAGNSGKGDWLLGAPFLKNVYFATNTQTNKVALGNLS
ncbi:hypothetical protein MVES1_002926 [Malassezia vespertilionis]|uniref:Peptidase A1 domain-containing protein n=1 Tax=Malassezia vespertilionis TaxID=2020962 RepID=A0A2N1J8X4_9BASI|nr:uncharacterized protein MVES1_002926 [Malassezia vespertilionis]PKI83010.1 hypothetical protein MVES_002776 [Malassezia vespertilionis]WFD07559.1 hypothetical protein MVES1_002926 [Malassezia vespertilionis]